MERWGGARKTPTADWKRGERRRRRRKNRPLSQKLIRHRRSSGRFSRFRLPLEVFFFFFSLLTFTLNVRLAKGWTRTHRDFIPQRCCHMISCSVCHLSVIYCCLFSPPSFTLNELVSPEASLHMEDIRTSQTPARRSLTSPHITERRGGGHAQPRWVRAWTCTDHLMSIKLSVCFRVNHRRMLLVDMSGLALGLKVTAMSRGQMGLVL